MLDNLKTAQVAEIKRFFSSLKDKGLVDQVGQADSRVFIDSKTFRSHVRGLNDLCDAVVMLGAVHLKQQTANVEFLAMLNEVKPVDRSSLRHDSGSGGGYHCDSFKSKQIKVFVYLTDVDCVEDGAFEVTRKIWTRLFKFINIVTLNLLNNSGSHINRFDYLPRLWFVDAIFSPMLGPAGTLFVADTTLIHRGRPNLTKPRLMLTFYIGLVHENMASKFGAKHVSSI